MWISFGSVHEVRAFRESGFRQFVSLSSMHLITDAMLMFGLEYAIEKVRSIHHSWKESSILTMPHLYP